MHDGAMPDERVIKVSAPDDGVVTLVLQRPDKKNALSIALRDEMSDALDVLAADEACRVVVISGAGDTFSAGFDLDEFTRPELGEQLWASSDRWHRTILEFPLPTVAAVNGSAYGGGFDLAVMCDLRIASSKARFGHPEHSFAQVVYAPLHDLVGGAVARDLALTGRRIDADEALRLGMVTRVVDPDALAAEAASVAAEIAAAPRDILLLMKAKIARRARITVDRTLDL
jgi:enoyl-CoA hydratase/carnithine racemase